MLQHSAPSEQRSFPVDSFQETLEHDEHARQQAIADAETFEEIGAPTEQSSQTTTAVGTHVTSGTETCARRDESQIRPRTVRVRTPVDQDWHEAKHRPKRGRIPGRPSAGSGYLRPFRRQ